MKAALLVVAIGLVAVPARAQTAAPPPSSPPPAAAASPGATVGVGGQLFADYTYTFAPKTDDGTGRIISPNAFNISRAYFTLTADVSPRISVRLTADAARESGSGTSFNGSYALRIKYAYAQFDLTPWLGTRAWARIGVQHTPFIDAVESVYRYRFQGTLFTERDASMSSSDAGATLRVELPGGRGDVHGGIYNGEGYRTAEANDQKSLQLRATYRPLAAHATLKGLSVQFFINDDHVARDLVKRRMLASAYFQHRRFHAGFDYLATSDRPGAEARQREGRGYSVFVTPFFQAKGRGPEALFRFDRFRLDAQDAAVRHRIVTGVAYWFPHEGTRPVAIMLDFEQLTTVHATPEIEPARKIAVHTVVSF